MIAAFAPDGVAVAVVLSFVMVALGAALQMSTGVGLGLIAGPFLLFVMDPTSAIRTAIVLNLLLSAVLLPSEWRSVDRAALMRLSGWAAIGIPLGSVFLISVDGGSLKLVSGATVLAAALQLIWAKARGRSPKSSARAVSLGGFVSGLMTGALAIPGPVALWSLLNTGIHPQAIRATLRAFFVAAYGFAYVVQVLLTEPDIGALRASAALAPAVLLGMAGGILLRQHVSPARLTNLFEVLLFLMGVSLVLKGAGIFG